MCASRRTGATGVGVRSSARRAAGLYPVPAHRARGRRGCPREISMSETTGAPGECGVTPPPRLEAPPVVSPSLAGPAEPLDPWFSIWTRPRATLRQILDGDPRRSVYRLAALGGIAGALKVATESGPGETAPLAATLAVAVAGGALGGVLFLFLFSGLVRVAGRWLGGLGGTLEIRAALAWSYVPEIWGMILWLPRGVLLGEEMFQPVPPGIEGNPPAALFFGLLVLAQTLVGFWGLVIGLKCIAEAHRFSAWRALGTLVLVGLMLIVPVGLLMIAARAVS